jgi:hypothetical protein
METPTNNRYHIAQSPVGTLTCRSLRLNLGYINARQCAAVVPIARPIFVSTLIPCYCGALNAVWAGLCSAIDVACGEWYGVLCRGLGVVWAYVKLLGW